MTTQTKEKKILADIDLNVYIRPKTKENPASLCVLVDPPKRPYDHTPQVRRFYRWAFDRIGLRPVEIWDPWLGYAVLPISALKQLRKDFSVHNMSRQEFIAMDSLS